MLNFGCLVCMTVLCIRVLHETAWHQLSYIFKKFQQTLFLVSFKVTTLTFVGQAA